MVIRPHISVGITLAAASAIAAAPAISPPLTPRDERVVALTGQRLSYESVDLAAASQPLVVEPASLLQGVALVDRVSGGIAPVAPLAAVQPDGGGGQTDRTALVVDDPADFFDGLLNAYLNGGSSAVTAYVALAVSDQAFGPDSVPSVLLGAYIKQGVVGVAGAVALLISDEVNGPDSEQSQSIADFLDGGVNKTIGKAFLAYSNEKFGEGSFASGLTASFFFGYPDGEEGAPTGLGGVTRFVFDSLIEAINESINGPAVSTTGAVSLVSQKSTVTPALEGSTDKVEVSVTNLAVGIKQATGAVERKAEGTAGEIAEAAHETVSENEKAPEEPEVAPKPDVESKDDIEAGTKAEIKAEAKREAETEAGTEDDAKPKAETKSETKPDNKSETKTDNKSETKTEAKAETKADADTDPPKKESGSSASTGKKPTTTGRSHTESSSNDRKSSASDSGSGDADGSSKKESKSDS